MTKFYNTLAILLLLSCLTACGKRFDENEVRTPKAVAKLSAVCTSRGLAVITKQPGMEFGGTRVQVFCYDKTTNLQYLPTDLQ